MVSRLILYVIAVVVLYMELGLNLSLCLISNESCRKVSKCGECGVCLSNHFRKDYCETKFFHDLFILIPPSCPIKDHCNTHHGKNNCLNEGTCEGTFGGYFCKCKPFYHGQICELNHGVGKFVKEIMVVYSAMQNALSNQVCFIVVKEFGDDFKLIFNNGGGESIDYNKDNFQFNSPKVYCLERYELSYQMCRMLPQEKRYFLPLNLSYPIIKVGEGLILEKIRGDEILCGNVRRFSVTIFNNQSQEFHQEYTKVILYPNKSIRNCSPGITLHNCGEDSTKAPQYFSNSSWTIMGSLGTDCSLEPDILCAWKIWRLELNHDSINSDPLVSFKGNNIYKYTIKPFTLKTGLYKVQLLVATNSFQNRELLNFANCYFEVKLLPLIVTIEGGFTRTALFNKPLVLNASRTYDPNQQNDTKQNIFFSWSCTSFETFCQTFTTREDVFIVNGPFKVGKTYTFNLKVWSGNSDVEPVIETQNISFEGEMKRGIAVKCLRNCRSGKILNLGKMIYIKASLENESDKNSTLYSWTYRENFGPVLPTDIIKEKEVPSNILIVKPYMLKEDLFYTFIVTGHDSQVEASLILQVKKIAPLRNCFISPKQGTIGATLFNISSNFSNTEFTKDFMYKFYEKNIKENTLGILLGSSTNGFLQNLMLTERYIVVRIIQNNSMYAEESCTVQLKRKPPPPNVMCSLLENLSSFENVVNVSDRVKSVSALASVIEFIPDKKLVIQKLFHLIPEKSVGFTDLTTSLALLNKIVLKINESKDDGLDRESVRGTSRLMNTLATKLVKWTSSILEEDSELLAKVIQEAAHSLLTCADVVVYSRSVKLDRSNKTEMMYNMSEIFISKKDNKFSLQMLSSLYKMSQVVAYSLLPSQPEAIVKTRKFGLWIKVGNPKELSNVRIGPDTNKSSITLSKSLIESLNNVSDCISLQVVLIKEDPFKYDFKAFTLSTEVLSLKIHHTKFSNHLFSLKNLKEPIDLYFKVLHKHNTVISTSAMLPNPNIDPDHKDLVVTVFKMEPPHYLGNCELFVMFHELKVNRSLRVIFLQGMRPDYDIMISESSSVTSESPVFVNSFKNTNSDDLYYLGIIPGQEVNPDDVVVFSFEVHYIQCLTRSNNGWVNRHCEVGKETTPDEIHCRCQHLSLFGGGVMVAPKEVDPVVDVHLFLSVSENPIGIILVASVLIVYLILLVWTRHKDNKDILQRTVIILEDNFPGEEWSYLVTVYTGWWIGAGTDARVGLQLFGTNGRSRVHILRSSKRKVLKRHCDDWFLVFTPESIGIITKLHIWHDCSGQSSDWYCTKIVVYDLLLKKDYYFPCNLWLSINEESEFPEAMLYPVDTTEVLRRDKMAFDNTLFGFRETHLWISIFLRHPRSSFTRSQRLSTVVSLMMLTMLTSIMFYEVTNDTGEEFPIYSIEKMSILVAMESQILTQPFLFLILFCFKKSRIMTDPKKKELEQKMEEWAFYQEQKKIELERMQRINKEKKMADRKPKPKKTEYLEEVAVDEEEEEEEEVYEEEKKTNWCRAILNFMRDLIHKVVITKPLMPIRITDETPDSAVIRMRWTIVAWTICETHIWVCGFFVMLYGLKLDEESATNWLGTYALAIGQSMFLLSPLKIIIFATILAVLFGKLYNVETFECKPSDAVFLDSFGDPQYLQNLLKIRSQPEYHPLPRKNIEKMRYKQKRLRRWRIVLDFLAIATFFSILFTNTFGWKPIYYIANKHISNAITLSNFGGQSLESVHNATEFHTYLYETLATAIFTSTWYNEAELSSYSVHYKSMGWLKDSVSRLVGTPRLRQQRVKDEECSVAPVFKSIITECRPPLTSGTEDTKIYSDNWIESDEDLDVTDKNKKRWAYVDAYTSGSVSSYGKTGQHYDGGGYITELSRNMEFFVDKIALLESKEDTWLDEFSRVVFVELTFYNPNVDFFYVVVVVAERLANGAVLTTFQNTIVDIMIYRLSTTVYIFIILVLYFLCRICFSFNKQGFRFFIKLKSYYEIVFNVIIFTTLGLYIYLIFLRNTLLEDLETNGQEAFLHFKPIIETHKWINGFSALLFAITSMRVLRGIRLGRRYETLKYTFVLSIHYLYIIILPVIVFVFIFVYIISFLLYMPLYPSYILITYRTLFRDLNKNSMFPKNKILPFFFCFISIIPMGFYMVILSYFYRIAKYYRLSTTSDFNFISFVYEQLKIGIVYLIPFLKTKTKYLEKQTADKFYSQMRITSKLTSKSRLRAGADSNETLQSNFKKNFSYLNYRLDLILIKLSDLEQTF